MKLRILLVDDQGIFRRGTISILMNYDPEWEFFQAGDGLEAIEEAGRQLPHVVLMDILMPNLDGIQAALSIREKYPQTQIIMLSQELTEEKIHECLAAGIKGFVTKNSSNQALYDAIIAASTGKHYINGEIMDQACSKSEEQVTNRIFNGITLTEREYQVLELIIAGLTSMKIGERLGISNRTVDNHRLSILEKTGMENTSSLIRFYYRTKYGSGLAQ